MIHRCGLLLVQVTHFMIITRYEEDDILAVSAERSPAYPPERQATAGAAACSVECAS